MRFGIYRNEPHPTSHGRAPCPSLPTHSNNYPRLRRPTARLPEYVRWTNKTLIGSGTRKASNDYSRPPALWGRFPRPFGISLDSNAPLPRYESRHETRCASRRTIRVVQNIRVQPCPLTLALPSDYASALGMALTIASTTGTSSLTIAASLSTWTLILGTLRRH